jgi:hypothetical protein
MPSRRGSFLLEFFDSYFGARVAPLVIAATGSISLIAALGLRSRARDERQRATSITMRQLLLLQLFALISLGCWTGMRFFALQSGSELERVKRIWSQREWVVEGDETNAPTYWLRYFGGARPDWAKENALLKEVVRVPSLRTLQLSEISLAEEFAVDELASAKDLQTLYLSYAGANKIDQKQVLAIGNIASLKILSLRGSGNLSREFEPIAKLTKLDTLLINDCTMSPVILDQLAESPSLRRLHLSFTKNANAQGKPHWSPRLEELLVRNVAPKTRWTFEHLDSAQSLRTLTIACYGGPALSTAEVEAISRCGALQVLSLEEAISEKDVELLGSLSKLEVLTIFDAAAKRSPGFRNSLEKLALLPSLLNLNCDHQIVIEEEEWRQQKPFPSLEQMPA